jgi:hypothetical protein
MLESSCLRQPTGSNGRLVIASEAGKIHTFIPSNRIPKKPPRPHRATRGFSYEPEWSGPNSVRSESQTWVINQTS